MATLTVHLFGRFDVRDNQAVASGLDARKVQELFSYLLLYPDRPHSREFLAGLLWGDCLSAQSKAYLRKAIWQLQSALAGSGLRSTAVLEIENEWVCLHSDAELWLDVFEFEQAYSQVRGRPGIGLDKLCVQCLQGAVDLYQGDLLEGWYHDWCLYHRERLQQMYLAMLGKLMIYCESHQDYEAGVTYGYRILRYDHAHEQAHQCLMRLYYLSGDRTSALRQYERCAAMLSSELGITPDDYTKALYEAIKANQHVSPHASVAADSPDQAPNAALQKLLQRLQRFQQALVEMQRQVQDDIRAVERALRK